MSDINIGAITEALNNKVDLPTPSTSQDAVDYVVEKQDPTSANGYTWYRKYKSGWVEQGGTATTPTNGDLAITLPIPMNPNQFYVTNSSRQPINNWSATPTITKSTNGTTIRIAVVPNSGTGAWVSGTIDWQVSGYEA